MLAHPNSGLSSTRQIGIGVCAKIEIIATAAKIPAMTATAMMIFFAIRKQHSLFCIHNMNYSPHLGLQRSSRSSIDALEGFAVT